MKLLFEKFDICKGEVGLGSGVAALFRPLLHLFLFVPALPFFFIHCFERL